MFQIKECIHPIDDITREKVAALYEQVFNQTYPSIRKSPQKCRDTVTYWFERCEKIVLVYGKCDDDIVGFMILGKNFLDELYLRDDYQHKGIGSQLIAIAKKYYESLSLYTLKQNKTAIAFYLKHGFSIVKYGIAPDEQVEDVFMEWKNT